MHIHIYKWETIGSKNLFDFLINQRLLLGKACGFSVSHFKSRH